MSLYYLNGCILLLTHFALTLDLCWGAADGEFWKKQDSDILLFVFYAPKNLVLKPVFVILSGYKQIFNNFQLSGFLEN